jgi:hypothetical protein
MMRNFSSFSHILHFFLHPNNIDDVKNVGLEGKREKSFTNSKISSISNESIIFHHHLSPISREVYQNNKKREKK